MPFEAFFDELYQMHGRLGVRRIARISRKEIEVLIPLRKVAVANECNQECGLRFRS